MREYFRHATGLILAGLLIAMALYGCAQVPAIESPHVLPPFPSMPQETKDELRACCTVEVPLPDGTVARKVKPGTEHIWQYLATIKDYKSAIDYSRALVDDENK